MEGLSSSDDEEDIFGNIPSHRLGSVKRRRNGNNITSNSKRIRRFNHVFEYGDKHCNERSEEEVDNDDGLFNNNNNHFRYTL